MSQVRSACRIVLLRVTYPGLEIDFASFIGRGCDITCTDDAQLVILRSHIGPGCTIRADHGASIEITGSSIGPNSVVVARDRVTIGEGCSIAEMVVVRDQDHAVGDGTILLDREFVSSPVVIGPQVWIGAKATLLRGTTVGRDAVIGAHSVVKGKVEAGAVLIGPSAERIH